MVHRPALLAAALALGAMLAPPVQAAPTKNALNPNGVRHNGAEAMHLLPPTIEALVLPGGFVVRSH